MEEMMHMHGGNECKCMEEMNANAWRKSMQMNGGNECKCMEEMNAHAWRK